MAVTADFPAMEKTQPKSQPWEKRSPISQPGKKRTKNPNFPAMEKTQPISWLDTDDGQIWLNKHFKPIGYSEGCFASFKDDLEACPAFHCSPLDLGKYTFPVTEDFLRGGHP